MSKESNHKNGYIRYSGERAVGNVTKESGLRQAVVYNCAGVRNVQFVTPDALEACHDVGREATGAVAAQPHTVIQCHWMEWRKRNEC